MNTTSPDDERARSLAERVRGAVLEPGDAGYDDARTVWNARIDREPALVLRCTGAADVVAGVEFAGERDVPLAVKGGGHHVSGAAVRDDALLLDLAPMDGVWVDPDARTARVQAGATWGAVDHETQAFGLATVGGQAPSIGVAGMTLGGGSGWLSRRYGMTIDNLLSVDLVTADGEFVTASAEAHPELFWGLRGGGGNFGVATAFEYRLHEVGPAVYAGSLVHPLDDASEVARGFRSFMADAPAGATALFGCMELPAAGYLPEAFHGELAVVLLAFHDGPPEEGEAALAPLRAVGEPVADTLRGRSYLAWQRAGGSTTVERTHVRSQYLEALTDAAIDDVVAHTREAPSAGASVFVSPGGGAVADVAADATAYPHRDGDPHLLVEARWEDPDRDDEHVAWVDEFHDAMRPYATGAASGNFLTDDELPERARAAYGDNYDRLAALKAEWDPENRFRGNVNVEPSG